MGGEVEGKVHGLWLDARAEALSDEASFGQWLLEVLRKAGLCLKPGKCHFVETGSVFLRPFPTKMCILTQQKLRK